MLNNLSNVLRVDYESCVSYSQHILPMAFALLVSSYCIHILKRICFGFIYDYTNVSIKVLWSVTAQRLILLNKCITLYLLGLYVCAYVWDYTCEYLAYMKVRGQPSRIDSFLPQWRFRGSNLGYQAWWLESSPNYRQPTKTHSLITGRSIKVEAEDWEAAGGRARLP